MRGRTLAEAKTELEKALAAGQAELDQLTQKIVAAGLASWSGGESDERKLIVRGAAHLLDDLKAVEDLERVRLLFDDLETKRGVIDLLGRAEHADGARIFIGSENKLFSLSGSSTIVAPYRDGAGRIVGVIGVIGPTRLNYARVIPMVDYTAKVVSKLRRRVRLPPLSRVVGLIFGASALISGANQIASGNNMMTDTTARPSVDAGEEPESREPASQASDARTIDPDDHASEAAELQGQAPARARRNGEYAAADRSRDRGCPRLRHFQLCTRYRGRGRQHGARRSGRSMPKLREQADAGIKALLDGVELTERELAQGAGEARGEEVRPARAEVRSQSASGDVRDSRCRRGPRARVAQVVQPGYMIGERVLRPALVGVAKGGPKPAGRAARQRQRRVLRAQSAELDRPQTGLHSDRVAPPRPSRNDGASSLVALIALCSYPRPRLGPRACAWGIPAGAWRQR